jgi:hypothetical protein
LAQAAKTFGMLLKDSQIKNFGSPKGSGQALRKSEFPDSSLSKISYQRKTFPPWRPLRLCAMTYSSVN